MSAAKKDHFQISPLWGYLEEALVERHLSYARQPYPTLHRWLKMRTEWTSLHYQLVLATDNKIPAQLSGDGI